MKIKNYSKYLLLVTVVMILNGCKITKIIYPDVVGTSEELTIHVTVKDDPESNQHYGVLGILIPYDWEFVNANYTFTKGNGELLVSDEWADSISSVYPANSFGNGYRWLTLKSDKAYSYNTSVEIEAEIKLKSGGKEGCYNLAFLSTKATPNLINSGNYEWAPILYPNSITVTNNNEACEKPFIAEAAQDWTNLFDTDSGWTGADGIYSIPINENELPGNNAKHLLLFSDTFIGQVDPTGKRINSKLVNNTLAVLENNIPSPQNINFLWNTDGQNPKALFEPSTPNSKDGEWYWLMDGIHLNDYFYVYALRLEPKSDPYFPFNTVGVGVIKFQIDNDNKLQNVSQADAPLYYKNDLNNSTTLLGQAIMPLTSASNNYAQDGYVYVYGPKDAGSGKQLVCARVLPDAFEDFSQYTFWDGSGWSSDIKDCAAITDGISQEFSVTPLYNGKFILVFQIGDYAAYRIGESPVGPFGMFNIVYDTPEVNISDNVFVYNAKAHPSLSDDNSILISYNVNTFDFAENINKADVYRPRFIKLALSESSITKVEKEFEVINNSFTVKQNYPNPFNPGTQINFQITKHDIYSLIIYNSVGEEISTLFKNKEFAPGEYSAKWFPSGLATGVYFYKMAGSKNQITKKMLLVK